MRRTVLLACLLLGFAVAFAACGAVTPYSGPQSFGDGRSHGSA